MHEDSPNPKTAPGASTEISANGTGVRGTVRIAPAVLIELIELTVQGIDGIAGLRSRRHLNPSTEANGGKSFDNGKIAVTVNGNQIGAAIAIAIKGGANVSDLSAEVQRKIGFAVGNMLGMTVHNVDIYIEEIIAG